MVKVNELEFMNRYLKPNLSYVANHIPCMERSPLLRYHEVQELDVLSLSNNSQIFLKGDDDSYDYKIRINNDKTIDIWTNSEREGVKGSIDSLLSWKVVKNDEIEVLEHKLVKGYNVLLPVINFNQLKPTLNCVNIPKKFLNETYFFIVYQKVNQFL